MHRPERCTVFAARAPQVSLEEFKVIMRAGPAQMSTALNRASAASAKKVARAKEVEEAAIQACGPRLTQRRGERASLYALSAQCTH